MYRADIQTSLLHQRYFQFRFPVLQFYIFDECVYINLFLCHPNKEG